MNTSKPRTPKPPLLRWAVLFLSLVSLIILPFVLFETPVDRFIDWAIDALPGAPYLAALMTAALALDVILPVPSSLVNAAAGAALGFALGTLVCWFGMTLGCLFGYWIGATGGTGLILRVLGEKELVRAESLATRIGKPALIAMRAVPVLAEASTIAAGATRYPFWRFVAVTGLANLGVAAAYAGVGAFAWSLNSLLLAFLGAVGIPVLAYAALRATARWTGGKPKW